MSISTVQSLAIQLLRELGILSLDTSANLNNLNGRGINTGDISAVLVAINGAFEEMFKDGPASLSEIHTGGVLRPSTGVTLTATQYSDTISAVTTYASWMQGCTVRIAGDTNDNEFVSSTKLMRPFIGGSSTPATFAATVYGDCIPLDSTVTHVLDPVQIAGLSGIRMKATREEFIAAGGFGAPMSPDSTPYDYGLNFIANKSTGQPTYGFVDSRFSTTSTTGLQKFLRFNFLPSEAYSILYRAKIKPPVYVAADIGTDIATDPGTAMPFDNMTSVLFAIARKRISGDPLFGNSAALPEIDRQYRAAKSILENSVPSVGPRTGEYH